MVVNKYAISEMATFVMGKDFLVLLISQCHHD